VYSHLSDNQFSSRFTDHIGRTITVHIPPKGDYYERTRIKAEVTRTSRENSFFVTDDRSSTRIDQLGDVRELVQDAFELRALCQKEFNKPGSNA
jgi:hypothetical protein